MEHIQLSEYADVLTFKEFMQVLKIGRTKAYELLQKQIIKSVKIGSNYRIPKTEIIKYIYS